jgi:hypothetical protein
MINIIYNPLFIFIESVKESMCRKPLFKNGGDLTISEHTHYTEPVDLNVNYYHETLNNFQLAYYLYKL